MPYYGTNGFYLPFNDNSSVAALGFDQSGDITPRVNASVFGNTKISTAQSKFGGSSAYFDGNGDYLTVDGKDSLAFGTNDFTIEFWYFPLAASTSTPAFLDFRPSATDGAYIHLGLNSSNKIVLWVSTAYRITSSSSMSNNTWNHIVLSRSGTSTKLFLNGVQEGSTYTDNTNYIVGASRPAIGVNGNGAPTTLKVINGYIDDLRIYKGVAKYTANFTPPTAALPLGLDDPYWQYCVLVMPMDGTADSTLFPAYAANSWTPLNLSVTAGAGNDSVIDSPTDYDDDGNGRGNYATLQNIIYAPAFSLSDGLLRVTSGTTGFTSAAYSSIAVNSGKWFFEATILNIGSNNLWIGVKYDLVYQRTSFYGRSWSYNKNGQKTTNAATGPAYGASYTTNNVIGVAVDADNGTITFYKNGVSQGVAFSSLNMSGGVLMGGGGDNNSSIAFNFGQQPFAYTPPAGFKALNTANLPEPTIKKSNTQFDVVTYTGNGAQQTIAGLDFTPDLVWIKSRSAATDHALYDTVRGATKDLVSNSTAAETTQTEGLRFGFPSQGGYAIGVFNGFMYIVSPKSTEVTRAWKTTNTATSGTASTTDGLANSNAMNDANHPAAQYCRGLTTGGYTDWYLPAKDELNFLYQNKANLPSGEDFVSNTYWSSTEASSLNAWIQFFASGTQFSGAKTSSSLYVRAVRRVPVNEYLSSLSGQAGFSIGSLAKINTNAASYVAWCWNAGETTTTNTDGSITSTVRANPSAGFSVVKWTHGVGSQSIGHGLNALPAFIILKGSNVVTSWWVWHKSLANPQQSFLNLNSNAAAGANTNAWNNQAPTSSVIYQKEYILASGNQGVAYCFSEVPGFSSFGSYTGNGNADGPFIHLGFKPALVIIKMSSSTGNWAMMDNKREGYNVDNDPLWANLTTTEGTTDLIDFAANGFKVRSTDASVNTNAGTYVYMAWAEIPFKNSLAE